MLGLFIMHNVHSGHVNADEPLCFVRAQDAGGAYIKTYLKR